VKLWHLFGLAELMDVGLLHFISAVNC